VVRVERHPRDQNRQRLAPRWNVGKTDQAVLFAYGIKQCRPVAAGLQAQAGQSVFVRCGRGVIKTPPRLAARFSAGKDAEGRTGHALARRIGHAHGDLVFRTLFGATGLSRGLRQH
jgi:hypothetical protein